MFSSNIKVPFEENIARKVHSRPCRTLGYKPRIFLENLAQLRPETGPLEKWAGINFSQLPEKKTHIIVSIQKGNSQQSLGSAQYSHPCRDGIRLSAQALGVGITAAENNPENNTWAQAKTGREFFVDTVLYRKLYTQIQINPFPLLLASITSCINPCCLPSSFAHQKNGNRKTTTMTAGADLVMTSNCRIFCRSCSVYKHNSEKYLSIVWFQFSASVTGFYLCADIRPGASETGFYSVWHHPGATKQVKRDPKLLDQCQCQTESRHNPRNVRKRLRWTN